jgi:hypothetical protein
MRSKMPSVLKGCYLCLGQTGCFAVPKDDVVVSVGIEGGVQVDKVCALIGNAIAQNFQVVTKEKSVHSLKRGIASNLSLSIPPVVAVGWVLSNTALYSERQALS